MGKKLPALKNISKLQEKMKGAKWGIRRVTVLVEYEDDPEDATQVFIYKADEQHELFVPTSYRRGVVEDHKGLRATGELDMQFNIHRRKRIK